MSETPEDKEKLSLSAALLAPINSIFEAQIHSARAFLNFVLQMGFRHKEEPKDIESLGPEERDQLEKERTEKREMRQLLKKKEETGKLNEEDMYNLRRLYRKYGSLYMQNIDFLDGRGNEFSIGIPNLALLPIKPLAVSEAEFNFRFNVATQEKKYSQMGAALKNKSKEEQEENRPWYLITDPKSIRGEIVSEKNPEDWSMKINVKVTNTEIPYGLEKLLVHLTNEMEPINKSE